MRVFIALPVPEEHARSLAEIGAKLKRLYRGISAIREGGFHITLFFLGEVDEEGVRHLSSLLDSDALKSNIITARFSSLGTFPGQGNPRVVFADIDEGKEEIVGFYQRLRKLLDTEKWLAGDDTRPFQPHVTIARNKFEKIDVALLKKTLLPAEPFAIKRCVLFQSILKPSGAEYIPLKTREFESP